MAYVSATASQGTCNGTETIVCDLQTIDAGGDARVDLVIRPTTAGTITNTATVACAAADPDTTNNAAAENTVIRESIAEHWLYLPLVLRE
jgi:hypothetical protein